MSRPRKWPTRRVDEMQHGDIVWVHAYNAWLTVIAVDPAGERHGLPAVNITFDRIPDNPYPTGPDVVYTVKPRPGEASP